MVAITDELKEVSATPQQALRLVKLGLIYECFDCGEDTYHLVYPHKLENVEHALETGL